MLAISYEHVLHHIHSIKLILSVICVPVKCHSTPQPLYNMLCYNTVLNITGITVRPQLDYICYMSIHFTLVITRIG